MIARTLIRLALAVAFLLGASLLPVQAHGDRAQAEQHEGEGDDEDNGNADRHRQRDVDDGDTDEDGEPHSSGEGQTPPVALPDTAMSN